MHRHKCGLGHTRVCAVLKLQCTCVEAKPYRCSTAVNVAAVVHKVCCRVKGNVQRVNCISLFQHVPHMSTPRLSGKV